MEVPSAQAGIPHLSPRSHCSVYPNPSLQLSTLQRLKLQIYAFSVSVSVSVYVCLCLSLFFDGNSKLHLKADLECVHSHSGPTTQHAAGGRTEGLILEAVSTPCPIHSGIRMLVPLSLVIYHILPSLFQLPPLPSHSTGGPVSCSIQSLQMANSLQKFWVSSIDSSSISNMEKLISHSSPDSFFSLSYSPG